MRIQRRISRSIQIEFLMHVFEITRRMITSMMEL